MPYCFCNYHIFVKILRGPHQLCCGSYSNTDAHDAIEHDLCAIIFVIDQSKLKNMNTCHNCRKNKSTDWLSEHTLFFRFEMFISSVSLKRYFCELKKKTIIVSLFVSFSLIFKVTFKHNTNVLKSWKHSENAHLYKEAMKKIGISKTSHEIWFLVNYWFL